jgi:hypothetical protein
MTPDDDIDVEALEARINLSMAYVDNLVSSWIKPSAKASLPQRNTNIDRELEEIMRRPPR